MIAQLARHYSWPHDFWRRMGVNEFNAWVEVTIRQGARSPESWAGEENNPFWDHSRHQGG